MYHIFQNGPFTFTRWGLLFNQGDLCKVLLNNAFNLAIAALKMVQLARNRYNFMMGANDRDGRSKSALLPGCGRPLNYIPKQSDPDYIGELFKNALSGVDIEEFEVA